MGLWIFRSADEKIKAMVLEIRKLMGERDQLLREKRDFEKKTVEDSLSWNRISQIEQDMERQTELLKKNPSNRNDIEDAIKQRTQEMSMLINHALNKDALLRQMNYPKKIEKLDTKIKILNLELKQLEEKQKAK